MTDEASNPNADSADKPLICKVAMAVLVELLAGVVIGILGLDLGEAPAQDPTPAPTSDIAATDEAPTAPPLPEAPSETETPSPRPCWPAAACFPGSAEALPSGRTPAEYRRLGSARSRAVPARMRPRTAGDQW